MYSGCLFCIVRMCVCVCVCVWIVNIKRRNFHIVTSVYLLKVSLYQSNECQRKVYFVSLYIYLLTETGLNYA